MKLKLLLIVMYVHCNGRFELVSLEFEQSD